MPTAMPRNFPRLCTAQLGDDRVLRLSCRLRDGTRFERAVDLVPIAAKVREFIRRYHAEVLHGDDRPAVVSGMGGWYRDSVKTASRIAANKAARQLWAQVQAHHGEIEAGLMTLGPYGQAAAIGMKTGFTIQAMVKKAKEGDQQAIQDVAQIVALSKAGDPGAAKVEKTMRAMNEMMNRKDAAAEQVSGLSSWWKHPYTAQLKLAQKALGRVRGRRSTPAGFPTRTTPPPALPAPADAGYDDPDYGSSDAGGGDGADYTEETSGWLYNRPYRVAAIGPGFALRGFFNLGAAL